MTAQLPLAAVELVIDVLGVPAPQGSKRHVGRGILVESSRKVGPWRDSVALAAHAAMLECGFAALSGPLRLEIVFRMYRPRSAPKSRLRPFQRPDLSKLVRSTEDALTTAGVWGDDAQVVDLVASKVFALPGEGLGARIKVRPA